jgi:hypothetical protein
MKLEEDERGHQLVPMRIAIIGAILCFILGIFAGLTVNLHL